MAHRVYQLKRAVGWDRQDSSVQELANRSNQRLSNRSSAAAEEATGRGEEPAPPVAATPAATGAAEDSEEAAPPALFDPRASLNPIKPKAGKKAKPAKISQVQPEIEMQRPN